MGVLYFVEKMKLAPAVLLSTLDAARSGYNQRQPPPNQIQPNQCYAVNVDIDGNLFRTNVVEDVKPVYTPQECQGHCQRWAGRGCVAWVFEEAKSSCTLYNGIGQIEYDEASGGIGYQAGSKVMGPVHGCLPCFRAGWDYVTNGSGANMQGMGYIEQVPDVFSCAKICAHVDGCALVSFRKTNNKCYLKTAAGHQGIQFDDDYDSATRGCQSSNCVKMNTEYANGYFARYDVLPRGEYSYIPGVATPQDCQMICRFTTACSHFTWQEGNYCYLVDSPYWLENDNDKISGSRDCVQQLFNMN